MAGYDFSQGLRGAVNLGDAWQEGVEQARAEEDRKRKIELERQATEQANQTRTAIGEALRTGNYTGAAAAAYAGGQDKIGDGFRNLVEADTKQDDYWRSRRSELARSLATMPDQNQRLAFAQQPEVAAILRHQGIDASLLRPEDLTDANIAMWQEHGLSLKDRLDADNTAFDNDTKRMTEGRQQQKQDFDEQNITLAPGATLYDGRNGVVKHQTPQIVTVGEGQTAVEWGSGNQPAGPISMTDASSRMAAEFARLGVPLPVVAGMLSNAQHESSWNPGTPGDGGTSHGYFQHRDPTPGQGRASTFQQRMGVHPSQATPEQTAQFVMWELTTPEGRQSAGISAQEAQAILSSNDPARAAMLFQRYYEKPKNLDAARGATASGYYATLTGAPANNGNRRPTVIAQGPPKADKADKAGSGASVGAVESLDRAIASTKRLLVHPGFSAAVGSMFDPASFGSINPFTGEAINGTKAKDFHAQLTSLKAQVFLPMVQQLKGMGALSNAEGEKLAAAIGALDPGMGEDAFRASLNRIVTDLQSYRARMVSGGLPNGGGNAVPVSSRAEIEALPSGTLFRTPDGKVGRRR